MKLWCANGLVACETHIGRLNHDETNGLRRLPKKDEEIARCLWCVEEERTGAGRARQ